MAIINNIGLGVVASHLIAENLGNGTVRRISTTRSEIINSISLVKLQDKIPTYTEKVFESYLTGSIEKMINLNDSGMKIIKR